MSNIFKHSRQFAGKQPRQTLGAFHDLKRMRLDRQIDHQSFNRPLALDFLAQLWTVIFMRHISSKERALLGLFKIRIFSVCVPSALWVHIICTPQMQVQYLWGGGTNGKDPKINIRSQKLKTLIFKNQGICLALLRCTLLTFNK